MAGNYPDAPNHRMAYDRDGTVGFSEAGGTVSQLSPNNLVWGNDENSGSSFFASEGNSGGYWRIGLIFPELRSVSHMLIHGNGQAGDVEVSSNTTNGLDGTWTAVTTAGAVSANGDKGALRSEIKVLGATSVKGIRWGHQGAIGGGSERWQNHVHLYGKPESGEAPNRLRFWHPTNAAEVDAAHFDWGDTPRNATVTKTFRVHNPSAQTANGVTLTTEALTDTTPTNVSQHTFSDDGTTFSSSLNVGNLAPGATSGVLTVRRVVPADAALSLWWARIVASAASYS